MPWFDGHVKTFSAALGSGFVELDDKEGEAYRFDVEALPDDLETLRSGDHVKIDMDAGTVREVKLVDGHPEETAEDEALAVDESVAQVTLKKAGKTAARFNKDAFTRNASRLDFK